MVPTGADSRALRGSEMEGANNNDACSGIGKVSTIMNAYIAKCNFGIKSYSLYFCKQ